MSTFPFAGFSLTISIFSHSVGCTPRNCPFSEEYVHSDSEEMSSRVFGPPRGARPPSIIRQRQRKRTSSCPKNVASSRPRGRKESVPKTSLRKESAPPRARLPRDSAPSVSFRDSEPKSGTGKDSNVVSLSKDSAPAFDISVFKSAKESDSASERRSARGFS